MMYGIIRRRSVPSLTRSPSARRHQNTPERYPGSGAAGFTLPKPTPSLACAGAHPRGRSRRRRVRDRGDRAPPRLLRAPDGRRPRPRTGRPGRSPASTTAASPPPRSTRPSADSVAALAREIRADVVVNACDPRLNPPIFDGAFAAGTTYLDMAMHLSQPHPERPYEETGVKLGDGQFAVAGRVGAGRSARPRRHRRRARALRRLRPLRRRPPLLDHRRGRRPRRRQPRDRRLRLRADVLDLDHDRGVPQPAGDLGARPRLVHDRAVLRARDVRVPRAASVRSSA